jgi:hypothetical protein
MEERICLKRQNYWIGKDEDDSDQEFRSLEFHPHAIKELHDALNITMMAHDAALLGGNPGQINDYHHVEIGGESIAIDWQLANLIKKLNDEGIETYGCDQGGVVPKGKHWEFDRSDYNGTELVTTRVTLNSGDAKHGFISFNMKHERLVVNLFSKIGLKAAC